MTPLDTRKSRSFATGLGCPTPWVLTLSTSSQGVEGSNPENPPYAATASGTRAFPGNNAPALHCEGSWQGSRGLCQASRGFRLYAGQGWARGCKAKPARPSGLAVFLAKELPRSWRAGSTFRAETKGHRGGRLSLKKAGLWAVSRVVLAQVVAYVSLISFSRAQLEGEKAMGKGVGERRRSQWALPAPYL